MNNSGGCPTLHDDADARPLFQGRPTNICCTGQSPIGFQHSPGVELVVDGAGTHDASQV